MANPKESKSDHSKFDAVKFDIGKELIQFAEKRGALFTLWSKGQKYSAHGRVIKTFAVDSTLLFTIARTDEVREFENSLERDSIKEVLFTVSLPSDVIFFKAEVRRRDPLGMNFKLIDPLFRAQRRQLMRLPILPSEGIIGTYQLGDEVAARMVRLHDLSAGGVGFVEEDAFQKSKITKGLILKDFSFTIRDRLIRVDLEVLFVLDTAPQKKKKDIRFGGVFKKIAVEDREFINTYVVEKSTQFFGRL